MARLGLKVFFLRTRREQLSQQDLASKLGVRQATLSNIERGRMLPTLPLLLELCRFFDVSPNYMLDDDRGVEPRQTERWSMRNTLVTTGMWIEAPRDVLRNLHGDKVLCPLVPGEQFYDDEARVRREQADSRAAVERLEAARRRDSVELEELLDRELQLPPRARPRARS
ncbi:MAG: helix-turn-helix transcriptional regulator [Planctomycetes bacterium]|nr:helix-turn-helix transcriptional regulator [Planctomycetota bacterium]